MSGDEAILLFLSGYIALRCWYWWYTPLIAVQRLDALTPTAGSVLLGGGPLITMVLLAAMLRTAAAEDVRDSATYIILYLVLGAAWSGALMRLLPFAGFNPTEDTVERGNGAAAPMAIGALLGCTLCYAGANVGNGPGWWVVVFSAGLATATLAVLWLVFDQLTGIADSITVERDRTASWRFGGLLTAGGLVLGRCVAGNWVSAAATARDFAVLAWPVLLLFAVASGVERIARPSPTQPNPSVVGWGLLPAVVYVTSALLYAVALGRPA
jgi:hypothetical protein